MELNYGIIDSGYRHTKYTRVFGDFYSKKEFSTKVLKNETFAFQIILSSLEEFLCSLEDFNYISWNGLINRIRVSIDCDNATTDSIQMSLVDYISDDTGALVTDILSNKGSMNVEVGVAQFIWVKGKVPNDFTGDFKFNINLHYTKGYDDEVLIGSIPCNIDYANVTLPDLKDGDFFLDLWQHPCSLARQYNVKFWSDDHFNIIDNYIKELASLGQRTITIVASDFPWAGQACFNVADNPSNLFEHNIVSVIKDKNGEFKLNFDALNRFIEICFKHGIDKEIDVFGLISNWDGKLFGNPLYPEYKDPFRINYLDASDNCRKYMKSKDEIFIYIKLLMEHFKSMGWLEKLRIFCDEPNNPELFNASRDFIRSTMPEYEIKFKCAVNNTEFLESDEYNITDSSVIIPIIGAEFHKFKKVSEDIISKGDTITWFVCCFPQIPNQFISSPPLESRLIGHITYMLSLSGFLRWNYCLYPSDVFNKPSYKFPRWIAGDMFFVYPGDDLKPMSSLRWENLRLGIEQYNIMKMLEKSGTSSSDIISLIEEVTGTVADMKGTVYNFEMGYSLDENLYESVRIKLIEKLTK
ncbi:MAG: DUF4091 domain-containing protein [Clostridium sp.]